jgi:hypothetical protein
MFIFPLNFNLTQVHNSNTSFLINNNTLIYTLSNIILGVEYSFTIPNVINTNLSGSTGLFQVLIYKNTLLL